MKKIYLLLLLFPFGMMAQTEEVEPIPEKVIDSTQTKIEEVKEQVYPTKDSIPTVVEKEIKVKEKIEKVADTVKTVVKDNIKPAAEEIATSTNSAPQCVSGNCVGGIGSMKYQSGTYEGRWKDGLRHGQGKFTWNTGDTYHGSWFKDQRHGNGVYKWNDGSKYVGHYSAGVRSGYGIYYYTNGNVYEGTWQSNLKHGIANFYFKESVNIGGRYINNEYVNGTGIDQESYPHKP